MNGINKIQVTLLWKWIVKKKCFQLMTVCFLTLIFASCNMSSAGAPGPRTWIDAPLNGSTLPLEPVVVRSHAGSEGGTRSAVLYVNGSQVSTDNVADPSAKLVEISQVWVPAAAGDYDVYVVAIDSAGNEGRSNSVRVHIGGGVVNPAPAQGGQSPEPVVTAETRIPESIQPGTPTFTFTTNANCREGPGTVYEVDDSFLQGQSVQIDGRNQDQPRWWWVLKSSGSHCWVSDSTGTASGPTENAKVVTAPPPPIVITITDTSAPPPPPPQETAPVAPGNLQSVTVCNSHDPFTVTLSWQDNATNESGYRVYRNGTVIANLGANAASYTENPPGSGPYNYKVEAYNNVGASGATVPDVVCFG